jgi:GAF domain-containing protein
MGRERSLSDRMADAARALQAEPDVTTTMAAAVDLATRTVSGCDEAGITLVERHGRVTTPAYTHEVVLAGDLLQYELDEGPCLDAIWEHPVVHARDLEHETRWPAWAPRMAHEHDVHSMMCVRLYTDTKTLGALNLYAKAPGSFDAEDLDEATALATHVAIAVTHAQENADLVRALDTRTSIGQACGILMERFALDEAGAFRVLSRVSSQHNIRISALAREFVRTRHIDGVPGPRER